MTGLCHDGGAGTRLAVRYASRSRIDRGTHKECLGSHENYMFQHLGGVLVYNDTHGFSQNHTTCQTLNRHQIEYYEPNSPGL